MLLGLKSYDAVAATAGGLPREGHWPVWAWSWCGGAGFIVYGTTYSRGCRGGPVRVRVLRRSDLADTAVESDARAASESLRNMLQVQPPWTREVEFQRQMYVSFSILVCISIEGT